MRRHTDSGFSLVELLIAMVVTLLIVGAVVGLLTGGQSAFKTQPERTDRQQNIRVAMDVIMRDVGAAGVGMPAWMQVFQLGLNNVGPAVNPSPDPLVLNDDNTDQISLFANTLGYANEYACQYSGAESHVVLRSGKSRLNAGPAIIVMTDGSWVLRNITQVSPTQSKSGAGNCTANKEHADIDFNFGQDPMQPPLNMPAGVCEYNKNYPTSNGMLPGAKCDVDYISAGDLIGYMVCTPPTPNLCPNGEVGVPNLYRNINLAGWQVLARGVENMQVQYVNSEGVITDEPPQIRVPPDPTAYTTITTEVRVTLSSRSNAGKLQGASVADQGPMAIRASLTSQASPRIALWNLTLESPAPATPRWN